MRNEAARSLGHRDWFALSLATDEMDEKKLLETLAAADRATSEPFARWKGSLDARLAERFRLRRLRASPVALRRPLLPGASGRGLGRSRPPLQGQGRRRARGTDVRGHRIRGRGHRRAERSLPAGREEPARVLHRRRPRGRRSHPCERDRQPQLDRHDAPRARPRGLRPRVRRRALVGVARHTPRHAPRRRRFSSVRWRATASGSSAFSGSMRARRTSSGAGCVPRELPSCWSSRAGCWS